MRAACAAPPRSAPLRLLLAAACFAAGPVQRGGQRPETALSGVLEAIENNRLDLALQRVEALIAAHPNFRLAHLINGDLLLARSAAARDLRRCAARPCRSEKVDDLRAEALARLRAYRDRPARDRVPRYLLQLRAGPEVRDRRRHAPLAPVPVRERRRPAALRRRLLRQLGKRGVEKTREGDQKTPIGVYHVTASLPRQKLSDFYGAGAFPINYPNEWDKRQGRNGHGIWLHGTPSDTYSRPPRASDGCIVLANADLDAVARNCRSG